MATLGPRAQADLAAAEQLCGAGRYAEAMEAVFRLLRVAPKHRRLRHLLGQILTQLRRYDEASAVYSALDRETPGDPAVALSQAAVLGHLDRHAEAQERLRAVLRADPNNVPVLTTLGQIQTHIGHHSEAAETFRRILAIDPDDPGARAGLRNLGPAYSMTVDKWGWPLPRPETAAAAAPPWASPATDAQRQVYTTRRRFILTDLVSAELAERDRFRIIDGGARDAFDDPRWRAFNPAHITLHGFEVDAENCAELNRIARDAGFDYHFHPIGLWSSTTEMSFYDNLAPGGGSFYRQNTGLTDRWRMHTGDLAREMFRPSRSFSVPVTTLADWARAADIDDVDFIKLNVQGAELEILGGAGALVDRTVGMQLEVSFVESYDDRPLFTAVDSVMQERGFVLFDFVAPHYVNRADSPVIVKLCPGLDQHWGRGQLIEAQALYLRDPVAPDRSGMPGPFGTASLSDGFVFSKLIKLAALSEMWGQVEFAFELLVYAARRLAEIGDEARAERVTKLIQTACERYRQYMWCS